MYEIMHSDNRLFQILSRLGDLIALNLLFVVTCLPLVTIGSAFSAMYSVLFRLLDEEETPVLRTYWKAFKQNFKPSLPLWLPMAAIALLLVVNNVLLQNMSGSLVGVFSVVVMIAQVLYLCVFSYLFPMLALFENTAKDYFKKSLFFSVSHFPSTLAICAIQILPVILLTVVPNAVIPVITLMLAVGFSSQASASTFFLHRVFRPYLPEKKAEPEDEWEQRVLDGKDGIL
ncbi:MAG: YesL family protein [Oscillospiraceae bacterium]|nr:YesL family protein [Oscillospiraceae bacterium]